MEKRILALLLSITMVLTTGTLTFAEESVENTKTEQSSGNTVPQTATEGQNTATVENTTNTENATSSSTNSTNTEQQVQAVDTENTTRPQVGDTVWIKSGSKIYKSTEGKEEYTVWFSHEIKIKNIIYDENGKPVWYEFEVQDWATGFLKNYSYIKVEDTSASEDEDTDSKECNCENPPGNLAEHADTCPRKQYVKSLITNGNGNYKTAKTIYADWENYDEATQTDILNMLEAYVETTYDELMEILKGFRFENFEGKLENDINVTVSAGMNAFPEGTTMSVSKTYVEESEISNLVSESAEILKIVAVDISFGCQPKNAVSVSIDIPDEEMPKDANMYYVIHMGDQGPELVTSAYLNTTGKGQTIPFTAKSFSTYVVVLVNGKYQAKLMRDVLTNDSQYTIKTLKANLFDYDAATLNPILMEAGNNKGFVFPEVNCEKDIFKGINLGGSAAKQGILANTLKDGLPVFNYLGAAGGVETGKILFDPETTVEGKDIYKNVDFEFIYDNESGYYTYNSAWNHAQLNASKDRVELYADTLSMANEFVAVADLSQYSGPNQINNLEYKENTLKGTISTTSDAVDPFVAFNISNIDADEVQNIRVRAKIKNQNGVSFSNKFTIYFSKTDSNYQEGQTISADYTSKGEWIDFVFDTTTCKNWSGTINGIRLDPIQDKSDSVINSNFDFEVAWVQLDEKKATVEDYRNGGYYPFSDISKSVPGRADQFNLETWKSNISSNYTGTAFASRSIFNTSEDSNKQEHLAFGTVIEQEFYIPVSGKTEFDEDIVFNFTGDDDLWVFVDDELVLDIGGGHKPVTGSINFTQKTNVVSSAITVDGYDSPTEETGACEQSGTLDEKLCSPGMHTMKIFYMERHSGVSNCLMKFNLPLIPAGSVVVSKEVQNQNGETIDALKNVEFTFAISGQKQNDNDQLLDVAKLSYNLMDTATGTSTAAQTDEKGQFTLTATQKAYFNITVDYQVTVEEINPSNVKTEGYGWNQTILKLNGESKEGLSVEAILKEGETSNYEFVNIYEPLYGNLEISKEGISNSDYTDSADQQSSVFRIEGKSITGEEISLELVLVGNESKVIKNLPIGNYTVIEITDWSWRYKLDKIEIEKDQQSATKDLPNKKITFNLTSQGEHVTFTNERDNANWLSGDTHCRNWWGNNGNVKKTSSTSKNN